MILRPSAPSFTPPPGLSAQRALECPRPTPALIRPPKFWLPTERRLIVSQHAAVALNNVETSTPSDGSSATHSGYTVSSGSDLILGVKVDWYRPNATASTLNSVTFNTSESLTQAVAANILGPESDERYQSELWYLLNPSVTTANIAFSWSNSIDDIGIFVFYLTEAAQQAPEATGSAGDTLEDEPFTIGITTVTDGALVVGGGQMEPSSGANDNMTPDGNTTEHADIEVNSQFDARAVLGSRLTASAGSGALSWGFEDQTECWAWSGVAAAFAPATGGGGGSALPIIHQQEHGA